MLAAITLLILNQSTILNASEVSGLLRNLKIRVCGHVMFASLKSDADNVAEYPILPKLPAWLLGY